jgi:hypothetical protein
LIVVSIVLQLLVTIPYLQQERNNKWSIDIPLDMSNARSYLKTFTPKTPYYLCYARFTMRGPVTDQFAAYRSRGGGNVPDELTRNFFSQNPFKVSWKLLEGQKEVCSGVFLSSDISIFVYPDYVLYTFSHYSIKGNNNLEKNKEYSFIGNVEQPCEPLNQLNPKLSFRREARYKSVSPIAALFKTIPAFLLGVILLWVNTIKNRLKKKKALSVDNTGTTTNS